MLGICRVLLNKGVCKLVLTLLPRVFCSSTSCVEAGPPCLVFPQIVLCTSSIAAVSLAFLVSRLPFLLVAFYMQTWFFLQVSLSCLIWRSHIPLGNSLSISCLLSSLYLGCGLLAMVFLELLSSSLFWLCQKHRPLHIVLELEKLILFFSKLFLRICLNYIMLS